MAKPETPKQLADQALSNRIISTLSQAITLADNWGYYLWNKKFHDEQDLRDKVAAIWLTSLLDNVDAGQRSVAECIKAIENRDVFNTSFILGIAEDFNSAIADVLSMYSREEQLLLQNYRNQIVHGHMRGVTEPSKQWRYFHEGKVVTENLTYMQFGDAVRQLWLEGLDKSLRPLRERFTNANLRYWRLIPLIREELQEAHYYVPQDLSPDVFDGTF